MIKNLNSIYVPNERKEKWIKLKPEYIDGVGDTLDLIILGFSFLIYCCVDVFTTFINLFYFQLVYVRWILWKRSGSSWRNNISLSLRRDDLTWSVLIRSFNEIFLYN
jgi:hypothetical protein